MQKNASFNASFRVCARCQWLFFGKNKDCPKCGFAHYGAIWTYGGWWKPFSLYILQHLKAVVFSLILVFTLWNTPAIAKSPHPEKWYQQIWCDEQGGQTEVIMPDGSRCDCLTPTHAIEFDFGKKWAEAIGQALCYGAQTGKRPGIVLIVSPSDRKFWNRMNETIKHHDLQIDTWEMRTEE